MKYLQKAFFCALLVAFYSSSSLASTLANCAGENGKAYYPPSNLVKEGDAGWSEDSTTGAFVTLSFSEDGIFNLLYKDATQDLASVKDNGGQIDLLAVSENNIAILIRYEGETTEIYDFYKTIDKSMEYTHSVVRPFNTLIPKYAAYVGKCNTFDLTPFFDWLRKADPKKLK